MVSGSTQLDSDGAEMPLTPLTLNLAVTPAGAENAVIAFAIGSEHIFGGHTWTGVTERQLTDPALATGSARSVSVATAENVPVALHAVSLTPASGAPDNSEAGVVVLAFSS